MSDAFTDEDYERVVRERDEALAKYQWMVDRACDEKLDGYRELAAKCAQLEEERDEAQEAYREARASRWHVSKKWDEALNSLSDAIRERDEARAEVERLREMAHDFEAMRQDRDHHASALKQERREVERLQGDVWALTTTLRNLPVPSPSLVDACTDAYRRGAEAMREAAINYARKIGFYALAADIRCLPIPEAKP